MWQVIFTAGPAEPTVEAEILSPLGATVGVRPSYSEEQLIAAASDADAILAGPNEPYSARVIASLTRCRIISRLGVGYDNIDVTAATRMGIAVAIVPDASIEEVSDHTIALLLACARKIVPIDRAVRAGAWRPNTTTIAAIRRTVAPLGGQVLGLAGLGRIGRAVAAKALALGLRVVVYDPYISSSAAQEAGVELVDFQQLLQASDYVSIHCPLTSETAGLFGRAQFQAMKPTAYLINTARGEIVDEGALHEALTQGYIAGAALDVLAQEPPRPDNPLLGLDNVIITAHSAYYSGASLLALRRRAAEAVAQMLRGEWPPNLVNPEVKEVVATIRRTPPP